jgi:hypothetical protein
MAASLKGKTMKRILTLCSVLAALAGVMCTTLVLSQSEAPASQDIKLLSLQVKSDKQSYLPGEMLTLDFRILNNSSVPVTLPRSVDVRTGYLRVFIAEESGQYDQYIGPRWGMSDVMRRKEVLLAPGESYETSATVLHNKTVETAHLSVTAAAEVAKGRIRTEYVLPKPGMYSIKAALYDDAMMNRIESEPISVLIEEPQGVDLEVWNKIKDDGDFALFMQTGEIKERPNGPKTKQVVETLGSIEKAFPTTRYVGGIRSGLAKRRSILDKQKKN